MSKNSKNAQRYEKARAMTKLHLAGSKGPAKTTPKHGKRWGYRTNPEVAKRIAERLKATQVDSRSNRTSGRQILAGAGSASE